MSEHSIISPSSSHRWTKCSASALLCRLCPNESSPKAERGTLMHEAAATGDLSKLNKKDAECVKTYLSVLPKKRKQEFKVKGRYHEEHFGTVDAWWMEDGILFVADFKAGKYPVSAYKNTQLQGYAGELSYNECSQYRFVIVQPEVSKEPDVWAPTRDEYEAGEADYVRAIYEVFNNPTFVEGDHCKFCPAHKNGLCEKVRAMNGSKLTEW